jgi:hypothetical protein
VRRDVQRQQQQEQQAVGRVDGAEDGQQARGRDAVGDHVEERAEGGGLVKGARGAAVELVADKAGMFIGGLLIGERCCEAWHNKQVARSQVACGMHAATPPTAATHLRK